MAETEEGQKIYPQNWIEQFQTWYSKELDTTTGWKIYWYTTMFFTCCWITFAIIWISLSTFMWTTPLGLIWGIWGIWGSAANVVFYGILDKKTGGKMTEDVFS